MTRFALVVAALAGFACGGTAPETAAAPAPGPVCDVTGLAPYAAPMCATAACTDYLNLLNLITTAPASPTWSVTYTQTSGTCSLDPATMMRSGMDYLSQGWTVSVAPDRCSGHVGFETFDYGVYHRWTWSASVTEVSTSEARGTVSVHEWPSGCDAGYLFVTRRI